MFIFLISLLVAYNEFIKLWNVKIMIFHFFVSLADILSMPWGLRLEHVSIVLKPLNA